MDDAGERTGGSAFGEQRDGFLVGLAAMHDERQPALPGGRDMGAEHLALAVARTVVVVEVEAGLADPDDLGMPRLLDQVGSRRLRLVSRLVGMNANRCVDEFVFLG